MRIHAASYLTYLLPSLYAAAFVRRTTSSTDLHPLLKRSLYLLRFYHIIDYTECGTFLKRVCHNTRTLLSYLHFYACICKSIYRLLTKTWYNLHTTLIILRPKRKRLSCFNTEILTKDENAALRHVIDPYRL